MLLRDHDRVVLLRDRDRVVMLLLRDHDGVVLLRDHDGVVLLRDHDGVVLLTEPNRPRSLASTSCRSLGAPGAGSSYRWATRSCFSESVQ